jgi:hypothetical protein
MRLIIPRFSRIKVYDGGLYSTSRTFFDAIQASEYKWIIKEILDKIGLCPKPENYRDLP